MSEEELDQDPNLEPEGGDEGEESTEDKARRWGWYPEGGDLSAEEFVSRAEENLPLMRSQLKKLDERNRRMEKQFEEVASQMGAMRKNAYEQAMRDLQNQQRQAVQEGDVDAYDRAAKELNDLNTKAQQETQKPQESGTGWDPDFEEAVESFKTANPWYDRDIGATSLFEQIHDRLLAKRQDLSHEQRMDMAKKETARAFPDIAKNPRRDRPGAVNEPGNGKGSKREKHFSDIPAEERATFERILEHWPKEKREEQKKQFAKRYFEGDQ